MTRTFWIQTRTGGSKQVTGDYKIGVLPYTHNQVVVDKHGNVLGRFLRESRLKAKKVKK